MSQFPPPPAAPQGQFGAESDKQFTTTWLLSWLLGSFGADRFYLGQTGLGVAKLLTGGGCGIWALIDLIMVLTGGLRDAQGRALAGYEKNKAMAVWVTVGVTVGSMLLYFIFIAGLLAASTTTSLANF